jgi:hypothetical protein
MRTLLFLLLATCLFAVNANAFPGGQTYATSQGGGIGTVQSTVPDPAKSQVTTAMTGTVTFYFPASGALGNVDVTGWNNLHMYVAADTTYYYNGNTTKTFICAGGSICDIFMAQYNVNSVTVVFGAGTNYVQGM